MVANGREAVQAFEEQTFDLILMDVQMPLMDGYEACRAIRAKERERNRRPTPIIALTARAMKSDKEACFAAGMDGYVTKPIRSQELRRALETYARAGAVEA